MRQRVSQPRRGFRWPPYRGGAQVSEVHANFIVNKGTATARDVMDLIELARYKVYETYGIELQPEVRFLGFS